MKRSIIFASIIGLIGVMLWQEARLRERATAPAQKVDTLKYFMAADSGYCQMSYYNYPEHGRKTAFNETFDSLAFTCAIDFNTPIFYNELLEISFKNIACTVRVNDRMSIATCNKFPDRDIDLAQAPAARRGMLTEGVRYMKWRKIETAIKGD